MTCSEKKGVERREGNREYVGCQEGHEGYALTGEWAGQAYACDGILRERAEEDPWTKEWETW